VKAGPDADRVLLEHMRDCVGRILEYTNAERSRFEASRLVQDAVIRNLQTLTESSQRLSDEIKDAEPQIPWRELAACASTSEFGASASRPLSSVSRRPFHPMSAFDT
jgi:hypothetical protein